MDKTPLKARGCPIQWRNTVEEGVVLDGPCRTATQVCFTTQSHYENMHGFQKLNERGIKMEQKVALQSMVANTMGLHRSTLLLE